MHKIIIKNESYQVFGSAVAIVTLTVEAKIQLIAFRWTHIYMSFNVKPNIELVLKLKGQLNRVKNMNYTSNEGFVPSR